MELILEVLAWLWKRWRKKSKRSKTMKLCFNCAGNLMSKKLGVIRPGSKAEVGDCDGCRVRNIRADFDAADRRTAEEVLRAERGDAKRADPAPVASHFKDQIRCCEQCHSVLLREGVAAPEPMLATSSASELCKWCKFYLGTRAYACSMRDVERVLWTQSSEAPKSSTAPPAKTLLIPDEVGGHHGIELVLEPWRVEGTGSAVDNAREEKTRKQVSDGVDVLLGKTEKVEELPETKASAWPDNIHMCQQCHQAAWNKELVVWNAHVDLGEQKCEWCGRRVRVCAWMGDLKKVRALLCPSRAEKLAEGAVGPGGPVGCVGFSSSSGTPPGPVGEQGVMEAQGCADALGPLTQEKARRVYYQDMVYRVCNLLDDALEGTGHVGTVSGTAESPSGEVEQALKNLIGRADYFRRVSDAEAKRVNAAEQTLRETTKRLKETEVKLNETLDNLWSAQKRTDQLGEKLKEAERNVVHLNERLDAQTKVLAETTEKLKGAEDGAVHLVNQMIDLKRERDEAKKALETEKTLWQAERDRALRAEAERDQKAKALEGVEALERERSKHRVESFDVGAEVSWDDCGHFGKIDRVMISRGGAVSYEVSWFAPDGRKHCQVLPAEDVELVNDDPLPIRSAGAAFAPRDGASDDPPKVVLAGPAKDAWLDVEAIRALKKGEE